MNPFTVIEITDLSKSWFTAIVFNIVYLSRGPHKEGGGLFNLKYRNLSILGSIEINLQPLTF